MQQFLLFLKKELKKSSVDYAILFLAGAIFLTFLKLFEGEELTSLFIVFFFIVFYVVWAAYHHMRTQTLHLKNVLEYALIGLTILLFTLVVFAYK